MNQIILIKQQVLLGHEAHYAGGVHLFSCLARTLSNKGWNVHVFTICSKRLLLHHAALHGLLHQLRPSAASSGLISWQAHEQLQYCVVTQHDNEADAVRLLVEAVACCALQMMQQHSHPPLVLLDADTLQHVMLPARDNDHGSVGSSRHLCSVGNSTTSGCGRGSKPLVEVAKQPQPFLQALMHSLDQCTWKQHTEQPSHPQQQQQHLQLSVPKVIMLVQNLHHLPFGPCGTAPRCLGVLQAWQQLSGILCVSSFVAEYMQQHALHLLRLGASSSGINGRLQPLHVVHPAALGAFGDGPFPDLGSAAASRLWQHPTGHAHQSMDQQQWQQQQQQGQHCKMDLAGPVQQQRQQDQQQSSGNGGSCCSWQLPPVVTMLKLTEEKGSDIFLAMANQLPNIHFRAVCADAQLQGRVAAAQLANVTLLPPAAAVSEVLVDTSLVIVPSILAEAFGLVVVDSMLRGLPVIVADAGALPEAAAGAAAAVLPVQMMHFPIAKATEAALAEAKQASCVESVEQQQQQQQAVPGLQTIQKCNTTTNVSVGGGGDGGGGGGAAAAAAAAVADEHDVQEPLAPAVADVSGIEEWMSSERSWQGRRTSADGDEDGDALGGADFTQPVMMNGWVASVQQVLSCESRYIEYSKKSKAASCLIMRTAGEDLAKLLNWLRFMAL